MSLGRCRGSRSKTMVAELKELKVQVKDLRGMLAESKCTVLEKEEKMSLFEDEVRVLQERLAEFEGTKDGVAVAVAGPAAEPADLGEDKVETAGNRMGVHSFNTIHPFTLLFHFFLPDSIPCTLMLARQSALTTNHLCHHESFSIASYTYLSCIAESCPTGCYSHYNYGLCIVLFHFHCFSIFLFIIVASKFAVYCVNCGFASGCQTHRLLPHIIVPSVCILALSLLLIQVNVSFCTYLLLLSLESLHTYHVRETGSWYHLEDKQRIYKICSITALVNRMARGIRSCSIRVSRKICCCRRGYSVSRPMLTICPFPGYIASSSRLIGIYPKISPNTPATATPTTIGCNFCCLQHLMHPVAEIASSTLFGLIRPVTMGLFNKSLSILAKSV
jgi:hypothetical protein